MRFVVLFFQFLVVLGLAIVTYEVGYVVSIGIVLVLLGNNFLLDLGGDRAAKMRRGK